MKVAENEGRNGRNGPDGPSGRHGAPSSSGLEDVVAATTRLSDVDGLGGRLVLAGRAVEDLAGYVSFEDAIHVLWHGREPTAEERARIRSRLGEAREAAHDRLPSLGDALELPDAMDALRAAVAHLSSSSSSSSGSGVAPEEERDAEAGLGAGLAAALRVVGAVAVFAAAWARGDRRGGAARPDPTAPHAADYLRLATGTAPSAADVDALDAYLVTVIDHGMNASTFTARVVASTASDTVSCVVAALGALKGKLHGGAPGPVLDMLDAIGTAADARAWIEAALGRGERIMGMGHRVYRVRDPRAFVLERAIARLELARTRAGGRLALARAVESEAEAVLALRHPERALKANVEFYTAVLLEAVGLPRTLFTPTFAVGRSAGWCAHVEEQRTFGRLIRPQSRYVDAPPTAGR